MEIDLENLRYPIGKFRKPDSFNKELAEKFISDIESFPNKLMNMVADLSDEQLNTPYRQDGWTIRQVVHHCSDSHMNSFIRFKLALTENYPTIKPYYEEKWAQLADSKIMSVQPSLQLLAALHERWGVLLRAMKESEFEKGYIHPERGNEVKLGETLALYAWHCNHHLAHISELKKRNNW